MSRDPDICLKEALFACLDAGLTERTYGGVLADSEGGLAWITMEIMPIGPPKPEPFPVILNCPQCGERHVDEGEWATKAHHTHACQACGLVWRPAIAPTVGVQFLPGFKNTEINQ